MDPITMPRYLRRRPGTAKISRDRFWVLASQNIAFGLCLGYVLLGTINAVSITITNLAIIFTGYGQ